MKTKIDNYSFNKTAKTVTFTDYTTIRLDAILLVTNVTDNIILYNFADATKGGTVLNNVLTLTYDTSSMDNTDKLLIYYDDSDIEAATAANQELMQSLIETLQEATIRLSSIASLINNTSQLRVIQSSVPSTAVTGPATSAQVIAALLTQSIALERYSANAIHANINNVIP
jgi:hypothetical protein